MKRWILILVALGSSLAAVRTNAETVGWRGDGTGRYPAAHPPTLWAGDSNVVWSTALTNWSNASAVLCQDRVFVCAEPATLICLNAATGKVLWERANGYVEAAPPGEADKVREATAQAGTLGAQVRAAEQQVQSLGKKKKETPTDQDLAKQEAEAAEKLKALRQQLSTVAQYRLPATHDVNGYSSGTPVTDGQRVYALFGNGIAVAYDFQGNRQWIRLVEKPTAGWGQSSSPALAGNQLFVLVNSLYALDTKTGETRWRTPAPQHWGTPVLARIGALDLVITPSGDIVRAGDGKLLVPHVADLSYCAPLVSGDVVYFIQDGGKAVRLIPDGPEGIRAETLWTTHLKNDRYYASPVLQEGLIYAITQNAEFSVIDAATGEVVHQRKLPLAGTVYPSIALGGHLLYVTSEGGTTVVLEPGREPKQIARNSLEKVRSSPVFAGDLIYLRGLAKLYCLGSVTPRHE